VFGIRVLSAKEFLSGRESPRSLISGHFTVTLNLKTSDNSASNAQHLRFLNLSFPQTSKFSAARRGQCYFDLRGLHAEHRPKLARLAAHTFALFAWTGKFFRYRAALVPRRHRRRHFGSLRPQASADHHSKLGDGSSSRLLSRRVFQSHSFLAHRGLGLFVGLYRHDQSNRAPVAG